MAKLGIKCLLKNTLRPIYWGVVCTTILYFLDRNSLIEWPEKENSLDGLLAAALSFGAIIIGFLGTAMAVLVGLDTKVMSRLKEGGFQTQIFASFQLALILAMIFAILCIVAMMFPWSHCWYAWIGTGISMLFGFKSVFNILFKLITL